MTKAIVLFSGGLDSRLAIKLLQEQNIEIMALNFDLPFGGSCCKTMCSFNFTQLHNVKSMVIDCTSGKLFDEYMKIIKKPKFGRGTAMNPCIDCRIFILKKAKEIAKKGNADFIATGEVLNERPMSQHKQAMDIIEKESGLKGKLLRPLSARLLPETEAEKKGLVNRKKLFDIQGRSRKKQIELAEEYKIKYPSPGGGCLLCEKEFAKKLEDLLKHKKKIEPRDIQLLKIGRHFRFDNSKIIVGRNEEENKKLLELGGKKDILMEVKDIPSPITMLQGKDIEKAAALTIKYSDAAKMGKKKVEIVRIK